MTTHLLLRLALLLALALPGCTMVLTEASQPEVRYVHSPRSPDETYARAHATAIRLGAVMLREDAQARTFTAQHKGGMALHVHVNTLEEGTQMTVTGSVLPGKVGFGLLSGEVDDFLLAYRFQR